MFDIKEPEKIYEKVIFLQDSEAQTALSILENEEEEADEELESEEDEDDLDFE